MKYFGIENPLEYPLFYYDIQKLFSIDKEDGKSRRSLETAVDMLGIEKNIDFHSAISDAEYTAKVFEGIDFGRVVGLYCAGGCTGCEKLARQIDKVHLENAYKMGLEL